MNESEKLISDKDEVLDETRVFLQKNCGEKKTKTHEKNCKMIM